MIPLSSKTFVGPWAGLPIAWRDDDTFDDETYRYDVSSCCLAGAPGVYTGGTTGEFYALEWDEFVAVTHAAVEECHRHGKPAMIGCTSTCTRSAVRRAKLAAEVGADAIQVALPFWMEVPDAHVVQYFQDVAGAADGLALSIYDTPRARKTLRPEQHRAIKEAVPQYLMVKSTAGTVGETRDGCAALSRFVNVFVRESTWAELGPYGAMGACSSRIYWNPSIDLQLWDLLSSKRWEDLRSALTPMIALSDFIHSEFAGRGFTDTAYDRLGGCATGFLRAGLRCRTPYPPPTEQDVRMFRSWCQSHFPEMLAQRAGGGDGRGGIT